MLMVFRTEPVRHIQFKILPIFKKLFLALHFVELMKLKLLPMENEFILYGYLFYECHLHGMYSFHK